MLLQEGTWVWLFSLRVNKKQFRLIVTKSNNQSSLCSHDSITFVIWVESIFIVILMLMTINVVIIIIVVVIIIIIENIFFWYSLLSLGNKTNVYKQLFYLSRLLFLLPWALQGLSFSTETQPCLLFGTISTFIEERYRICKCVKCYFN